MSDCPECGRKMKKITERDRFNPPRFHCGWCGHLVHFDSRGTIIGNGHGHFYRHVKEARR